jgi:hypothetical protein
MSVVLYARLLGNYQRKKEKKTVTKWPSLQKGITSVIL